MFFRKESAEVAGFSKEPNASRGYDSPMRFSLATLLLVVLWIGAAMAVWTRREPWVEASVEKSIAQPTLDNSGNIILQTRPVPDPWRRIIYDGATYVGDEHGLLWEFPYFNGEPQIPYGFVDENTLKLWRMTSDRPSTQFAIATYHRRFPEWWWGHFYRPEVWLFALLSGILVWRIGKTRMNRLRG